MMLWVIGETIFNAQVSTYIENAYQIFCYLGEIIDISCNHDKYVYIIYIIPQFARYIPA